MKGMEEDRAKKLFCSHAFRRRDPPSAYEKLVQSFVEFCGGLPLSLIVLGAHVYGRNEHDWELELKKVMKTQPKDIMQRLKISFDGLDREEQQIFIDIACFFNKLEPDKNWELKSKAITIWKASGWNAEHVIRTLQEKCLLEVVVKRGNDIFEMHDHLRDLGRQMAEELGPPRLWQPELLRSMEAKGFEQILAETMGHRCFNHIWDSSIPRRLIYFTADTDFLWLEILYDFPNYYSNRIDLPWFPIQKLHCLVVGEVPDLWSRFQQQFQTNNLYCSRSSRFDSLDISKTEYSSSVLLSTTRRNMCHNLKEMELKQLESLNTLRVSSCHNLKEMELKQLESLNTLQVHACPQLEMQG